MRIAQIKRNKYVYLLISIILGINISSASASAEIGTTYEIGTGDTVIQLDDLLNSYKSSSSTYNRSIIEYEIENYNGDLASENYCKINTEYIDAVEDLGKLQELRKSYTEYRDAATDPDLLASIDSQIQSIDAQIEQYQKTTESYRTSMAEAKLQADVSHFYTINQNLVQQEAKNRLTNDFLKKCYSLIILKENQNYYSAYNDYLTIVDKIENVKYKRGLIDLPTLELADTNILKNTQETEINNEAYHSTYSYILNETKSNNTKIVLSLSIDHKVYDPDLTESHFINGNSNLAQFLYLKQCYQDYLNSNYGSYTLYKQIELRIKDYQLQYDELKANIEAYVSNGIFSYNSAFDTYEIVKKELELAINYYNVTIAKKDHKKATELDVNKAKYEMEAAQVSYNKSINDIIIWRDILDNSVYGATP